ncbi:hypothetical protein FOA43_003187 [Brettanomyces nanus]|uniref:Transcription initiation factor TFIID subunit 4 n=1 Tax=Eeniella nana TaxID=13502 RepID=A0A875S668_EENNA|nr:uncharacterized protein FOA43_003187 [Brettanomyces nanus]QPG75825.1 hypothetical protein FOA43_003187 [Brettanomyces nanus]
MSKKSESTDELSGLATPRLATPTFMTPGDGMINEGNNNSSNGSNEYFTQHDIDKIIGSDGKPKTSFKIGASGATGTTKSNNLNNPEELADAVAAAGVNIRAEEEAMAGSIGLSVSRRLLHQNHFLKPQQLAWFMNKAMEEQGMTTMGFDLDLLNLMSSACESYMTSLVADSVVMSRHRRRGMKTRRKQSLTGSKSEISRALKEIAVKQKFREEKRVQRRIALGLEEEKKDEQAEEQTQTNITASLMMSGSMKKRYSWMQTPASGSKTLNSRGDNGIRYREAREESGIVMRDLLAAIENRRMGVSSAVLKGYAKLRD